MPSQIIEQIRAQFYASMGINEYTPISDAQAPMLIDQWEQYLYSYAQQSGYPGSMGGGYQSAPPMRPGVPTPVSYVPPNVRSTYTPGQIYNIGGGTYVGPPAPGSVAGRTTTSTIGPARPYTPASTLPGRPAPAPVYPGSVSGGVSFGAPPPRT